MLNLFLSAHQVALALVRGASTRSTVPGDLVEESDEAKAKDVVASTDIAKDSNEENDETVEAEILQTDDSSDKAHSPTESPIDTEVLAFEEF